MKQELWECYNFVLSNKPVLSNFLMQVCYQAYYLGFMDQGQGHFEVHNLKGFICILDIPNNY